MPSSSRHRSLRIDRAALRQALGGRAEVTEAHEALVVTEAPKAAGRLQVNAGRMWSFMTTAVYQSGDLPVLATREALQNSLDAIRAAVRARQIGARAGRFAVTWDPATRRLAWEDNGIGMDAPTVLGKFLSLGDSGKGAASSSDEAAGGFGVAKAVILGTSETFRWVMHTRDNRVVSLGADQEVQVFDVPRRQGTLLTVEDVPARFDSTWDRARGKYVDLAERLREVLGVNDVPDVELLFNGEKVSPLFSRRGGSRVSSGPWGEHTTATVKAYHRAPGDRRGAYYVRLGGLYQFKQPSYRGNLKTDVVIDLTTKVRPGAYGYPLNAGRDALLSTAASYLSDLVDEVEKENESVAHDKEFEVFDPESDDAGEREGAKEIADLTAQAFADKDVQDALRRAVGGVADYYGAQRLSVQTGQTESDAPAGTRVADDGPTRRPVMPPGFEPTAAADDLKSALEAITPGVPASVRIALGHAAEGRLDETDARALERAIDGAVVAATGAGGGGLVQVAPLVKHGAAVLAAVPARDRKNPFGKLAGLRINKKKYNRGKAYRFRKGFARWMPELMAWDATLRLIAREAQIRRAFKPGFVLDDQVVGLAATSGSGAVVYIHPDRLANVIRAHRARPLAVAAFLHGVAVHELTHLDGRMGQGHDEAFVAAREDLGHATGHLIEVIAVLAQRLLKLPETAEQRRARAFVRTTEQLRQAGRDLARAKAESASIARSCACGNCGEAPARARAERVPRMPLLPTPSTRSPDHDPAFAHRSLGSLLEQLRERRARGDREA